ncbi:MAG TPA: endopeptidase La [Alphaproteobacteria bacterium]|nr:endopeptidase La [Alphaproteobacteria bacterium]HOO50070.1 endopeptidase La [Alphaproteobacteria bacterium]
MLGFKISDAPLTCPVLPLRDIVVFPHMIVPLFVGREKSVAALEKVMDAGKQIILLTQKSPSVDDPVPDDLYQIGTIGTILQLLKLPDGTVKVLVEGERRARISKFTTTDPFLEVEAIPVEEENTNSTELESLARAVVTQFEEYVKLNKKIPPEVIVSIGQIEESSKLADTIASHLTLKIEEKQKLLEVEKVTEQLEQIFSLMEGEIGVLQVEKRIRGRVKRQMEKTQREYYLNEQMKAIQKELGDAEGGSGELEELEKKINETRFPKEAKEKALGELKKLKMMSPMSAEATVVRNYLDWLLSVPWKKTTKVKKDIRAAEKILDTDHYSLEKVKDRILEYLAVQQRANKLKGPILCLVGPPGVGKTSLGQSIAKATNRNFVRISLGGVRDESEIRGHRRTYIGAMPGKIIQGMKKAKTSNPLFLLDEIDKLASDWRGDPSSALLEVLDPEQNGTFSDHYLETDYDLSDVMFICTANSLNMPRPLLDRMEIIRVSGYTEDEKLQIIKQHLLKKQMKNAGLKKTEFSITDHALRDLIRYYTREAGVRNLERELANLCRKATKEILQNKRTKLSITPRNLGKYAGVRRYSFGEVEENNRIGVVNGLAYTEVGGDLLSIEAVTTPGKDGKLTTTGNLKEVMKESITVAEMLIKSRSAQLGISYEKLKEMNIHVHVPEGATPKDGPSAGAAMVTAIVSALTGIEIRRDIAMTGEVNLRGYVTEIGGLKEKLLAALRGGITKVLIPQDNAKDLEEIPQNVKKGLEIVPVRTIEEVLSYALVTMPEPLNSDENGEKTGEIEKISPKTAENQGEDVIRH